MERASRKRPPRASSLDHLVGAGEERGRKVEANCSRGLKIDDQLELGRQLDRQVGGPGSLENAINPHLSFTARRFVLFSARDSVEGGPYVVEAAYPLGSSRFL
jgi:hypothetical protein